MLISISPSYLSPWVEVAVSPYRSTTPAINFLGNPTLAPKNPGKPITSLSLDPSIEEGGSSLWRLVHNTKKFDQFFYTQVLYVYIRRKTHNYVKWLYTDLTFGQTLRCSNGAYLDVATCPRIMTKPVGIANATSCDCCRLNDKCRYETHIF